MKRFLIAGLLCALTAGVGAPATAGGGCQSPAEPVEFCQVGPTALCVHVFSENPSAHVCPAGFVQDGDVMNAGACSAVLLGAAWVSSCAIVGADGDRPFMFVGLAATEGTQCIVGILVHGDPAKPTIETDSC